jgi:putative transposase
MTTARQKLSTYAITILTLNRHRHFQRTGNADLFIATLFRYRDAGKFLLHGFAVMPDHVHVLVTPAIDVSTAKCIQLIKGGYSFAVEQKGAGGVWHSGYHDHRIRDEDDFHAQLLYIANNPARKRLQDYPHVHTAPRYSSQLDVVPKVTEPPALSSRPLELSR